MKACLLVVVVFVSGCAELVAGGWRQLQYSDVSRPSAKPHKEYVDNSDVGKERCSNGKGHWEQNGNERTCIPDDMEDRDACGLKRDHGVDVKLCRDLHRQGIN